MLILVVFFTISISPRKPHDAFGTESGVVAVAAPRAARKSLKRACGGCPDEVFSVVSRPKNHVQARHGFPVARQNSFSLFAPLMWGFFLEQKKNGHKNFGVRQVVGKFGSPPKTGATAGAETRATASAETRGTGRNQDLGTNGRHPQGSTEIWI